MSTPPKTRLSSTRRGRGPEGFTLMELLIVIGILVLLMSLLIPVLSMVTRQGQRTKTAATLSSVATALDQYRSDFGDYPRFSLNDPTFPNSLNSAPDRGARLLARALFGPAPANDPRIAPHNPSDPAYATPQDYLNLCKAAFQDGVGDAASPFGFKERRQLITRDEDNDGTPEAAVHYPGKVFSYLDPERFQLRQIGDIQDAENDALVAADGAFRYGVDTVLLDPANNQAILYYPALAKQPDLAGQAARPTSAPPVAGQNDPISLFIDDFNQDQPQQSLFNAFDNRGAFDTATGRRWHGISMIDPDPATFTDRLYFRELMGDFDQDGMIGPGETASSTGPYLLIAGGIDGLMLDSELTSSGYQTWFVRDAIANFTVPEPR